MLNNFIRMMTAFAFVLISVQANAAQDQHNYHQKGRFEVTAKIEKIITYENGMSLILDRNVGTDGDCVHIENAASFARLKLEKIERAPRTKELVRLVIEDGHVVDIR